MLSTKQFLNVETDPTKSLEIKIQRILRKIKSKFPEQEYKRLYPTGSRPGKFYGTAKMHRLSLNGKMIYRYDQLFRILRLQPTI